jgi:N-acylneuraminate cytidylyltransferase
MSITAIIPVRKGSRRIPNKNLQEIAPGLSLLEHKIRILSRLNLDEIQVNTDCEEMAQIGKSMGCKIVMRDARLSDPEVPVNELVKWSASMVKTNKVLWAQVTSPLITTQLYLQKFDEMHSAGYEEMFTVTKIREFTLDAEFQPINFRWDNMPGSEQLPEVYHLNFAIHLVNRESMLKLGHYYGERPYIAEIDPLHSIDIDNYEDLFLCRLLYPVIFSDEKSNSIMDPINWTGE